MITSPVTTPSQLLPRRASFSAFSMIGANVSPFTAQMQFYVHAGEWLEVAIDLPPMERADAEEVVGFLLKLNGREHSFLLRPPGYHLGARGSLAGAPVVMGGGQSGKVLSTDGWTPSAANVLKTGDWFQLGTSANSYLYKVVQAASADVYGQADLEIWPRLRASPSDNDPLTVASPKGVFRLADDRRDWDIEEAMIYGISFRCREDI